MSFVNNEFKGLLVYWLLLCVVLIISLDREILIVVLFLENRCLFLEGETD